MEMGISALRPFFVLTKGGIVIFVLLSGLIGYALGYSLETPLSWLHFTATLFGLAAISAGSFALNQVQEVEIDRKMKRTAERPIASGWIGRNEALWLAMILLGAGLAALHLARPLAAVLGFLTVVLYNGFYTVLWKRKWAFGAVPGAIPGAMPVVIGYAAITDTIFTIECAYLFLVMFLWQMPHFWAIALKLREDYDKGGIPVLPLKVGAERTLFHIGLYTFVYLAVAMASPWFVQARYSYLFLVVPMVFKLLWEFVKYIKSQGEKGWLPFFIWTNISVLIFLIAPVVDKWIFVLSGIGQAMQ